MTIRHLLGVPSICVVTFLCLLSTAHAQTPRVQGPFAGLFGGTSQATHSLDFRGSLFGAYQEVFLPPEEEEVAMLDPQFQKSGTFAGASGTLNYTYGRRGDHAFFNVAGHGSVADYSVRPDVPQYTAGVSTGTGLSGQITPKVRYSASAAASYSPYLGYAPFSSSTIGSVDSTYLPPQFGFAATNSPNVPVSGSAELTDQLSKRSSLSATLGAQKLFVLDDASRGAEGWNGRVLFSHRPFRTLGFHVGYRWLEYRYSDSDEIARNSGLDAGFDFGDALTVPLGRRTTASFSGAITGARTTSSPTYYALTGTAEILHSMGRTWSSSAEYHRSLGFIDLFSQPVLSDSVSGSVAGLVAPRVSASSHVGWTHGRVGVGSVRTGTLAAVFASSTLTVAVSRRLGFYTQYVYYRYEVPAGPFTRLDLPSSLSRQAVSVGLSIWVPIFNNARSRRDSR
jgi:hypothetical protein